MHQLINFFGGSWCPCGLHVHLVHLLCDLSEQFEIQMQRLNLEKLSVMGCNSFTPAL